VAALRPWLSISFPVSKILYVILRLKMRSTATSAAVPTSISYMAEDNKKSPVATWPPGDFILTIFRLCDFGAAAGRPQGLIFHPKGENGLVGFCQ
jgi:hypothetical protein